MKTAQSKKQSTISKALTTAKSALSKKAGKAGKAIAKAAKQAGDTISLTAKTWKADVTQVLVCFAWAHDKVAHDVIARLVESDSTAAKAVKTGTILFRGARGTVARDVEYAADGRMRARNYAAGGTLTGWFRESDVTIGGAKIEHFANAEALAKTFRFGQTRKAAGSSQSYDCVMENDLSKTVYSASVRKLANGKLIAWHEEDKRNSYNAHEVSATEKEAQRNVLAQKKAHAFNFNKAIEASIA